MKQKEEKIKVCWFRTGDSYVIGLVLKNGLVKKCRIGVGSGENEEEDIKRILISGAYFPIKDAERLLRDLEDRTICLHKEE